MNATRNAALFLCVLLLLLAACQPAAPLMPLPAETMTMVVTPSGVIWPSENPQPTPSLPPPSVTPSPSPSASPTARFVPDLSQYDPDIFQPIDVSHNPPMIARTDETVALIFSFANIFCMQFPVNCIPQGTLYYTYGNEGAFQAIPFVNQVVDGMESLTARLPAADPEGSSLRYYAEFAVPEVGYILRYPGAGTIDLFTTAEFIPVELSAENEVEPGEIVYDFFWGFGADKVRQATYEGYPQRVGPPAMDVADDGRIALMDPVNERIIIFDPSENSYSSFPMPFSYKFNGDVAFNRDGQLVVFDWVGEVEQAGIISIPQAYHLRVNGELDISTPVYVKFPAKISRYVEVLDYADARLVVPFDSQGKVKSREAQRQKDVWEFPLRYVDVQDPYLARYADVQQGLAFEVYSVNPLGVLTEFAKTSQGYVLTFLVGDHIRAVWIDASGNVLKDVCLPNGQYSEINFYGQQAITLDGSVYIMGSTERGIEIHYEGAP